MSLTISLTFPTGRYVAASWDDKSTAEWPPHPARLCLALIDTLHRAGNPEDLRTALLWLCKQGPPEQVVIPSEEHISICKMDGFFVPQNPSKAKGTTHSRKARAFPSVVLDSEQPTLHFHWAGSMLPDALHKPLSRLLASLPRFGHSSSLVIVGQSAEPPPSGPEWEPLTALPANDPSTPDFHLRVPYDGLVASAEQAFDAVGRQQEMEKLINTALETAAAGRAIKPAVSPRPRHDPRHHWQGYVETPEHAIPSGPWKKEILILSQTGGTRLGLPTTWQLTEVLHKAILDRVPDPVPSWISGHAPGSAQQKTAPATSCHLAIFPLASVGHQHASGHLLGLGIALPRPEDIGLTPTEMQLEWRRALATLLGSDGRLELTPPDHSWTIQLKPEDSLRPKLALQPRRWTRKARIWHSVTPIILDRHPKPHFKKDPAGWEKSCCKIIAAACEKLGLPKPESIDPSPYSPLTGVPAAPAYPAPKARNGCPARFHVHASLSFAEPIEGPLLLGAGRFRGYGLCLPSPSSSHDDDV